MKMKTKPLVCLIFLGALHIANCEQTNVQAVQSGKTNKKEEVDRPVDPPVIDKNTIKASSIQILRGSKASFYGGSGISPGRFDSAITTIIPLLPCIWVIIDLDQADLESSKAMGVKVGHAYYQPSGDEKETSYGKLPKGKSLYLIQKVDTSLKDEEILNIFGQYSEYVTSEKERTAAEAREAEARNVAEAREAEARKVAEAQKAELRAAWLAAKAAQVEATLSKAEEYGLRGIDTIPKDAEVIVENYNRAVRDKEYVKAYFWSYLLVERGRPYFQQRLDAATHIDQKALSLVVEFVEKINVK